MEELPQDLALALDDPSLKHDSDEQGELSELDMKIDAYRRRKMRKRRTTNAAACQVSISAMGIQLNNSPKSSSSLDEGARNSRYVESFTANCSDETDERPRPGHLNGAISRNLPDRSHHKRVFKQAKPCYCESDSHTENAPVYPRKHRKKKLRRMSVDTNGACAEHDAGKSSPCIHSERRNMRDRRKFHSKLSEGGINCENVHLQSKNADECQTNGCCCICASQPCDKLLEQTQISHDDLSKDHEQISSKAPMQEGVPVSCQCLCHASLGKEDFSHSGSSCNSDTDFANSSPGGDGDDEMTDFYAESDGGPVFGIPRRSYLPIRKVDNSLNHGKGESVWSYEMNNIHGTSYHGNGMSRFVADANADGRLHGRQSRYSKKLQRYCRRLKRRPKVKITKLSLGNRNKRIRLEGIKDCNTQQAFTVNERNFQPAEWSSRKLSCSPSINFTTVEMPEQYNKEDMEMASEGGNELQIQNV